MKLRTFVRIWVGAVAHLALPVVLPAIDKAIEWTRRGLTP